MDICTSLAGLKMRSPLGVSLNNLDKSWFPGKKAAELFKRYVKDVEAPGVDIIELNTGCPVEVGLWTK